MRLNLIDGYGYVFRAFYALPPLTDNDGNPVGALYGFCRMILSFMEKRKGEKFLVVLDSGKTTHRHRLYEKYKANRNEAPEDLKKQLPLIRKACQIIGIPYIEHEDYEADDIIASYAKKAQKSGIDVQIVSSDKDLMQLIDKGISMWDPIKGQEISVQEVEAKFGVPFHQIVEVQALIGDTSDNIPGVPNIGPKTAATLINEYKTLENLYDHIEALPKSKRKESLMANKNLAFLSRQLVTLYTDTPTPYELDELDLHFNKNKALDFFKTHNFKTLVQKIESTNNIETLNIKKIINIYEFLSIVKNEIEVFFIPGKDKIECFCKNYLFTFEKTIDDFTKLFQEIIENPGITKVGFNFAKLLCYTCIKNNINCVSYRDIYVLSFYVYSAQIPHTLESLRQIYNTNDVAVIFHKLLYSLQQMPAYFIYERGDRPLVKILAQMENDGICLDIKKLEELRNEFENKIEQIEQTIHQKAGIEFNINSPKQLSHILFEKFNMPFIQKNKSGTYSTDSDILNKLAQAGYDFPQLILEYRLYTKLLYTYINVFLEKNVNGVIHTNFSQASTLTGRLSSSNPNLQTIPIRTHEGRKIRSCFIPSNTTHKIVSFDYSQIELRLLAHYSKEPGLIESFKKNEDIHISTAQNIFNVKEITEEQRRHAKTINFGIIYGISAHGLAENLNIERNQAQKIINTYFERYPKIKEYINQQIQKAQTQGYVETIFKRRIAIKDINAKSHTLRQSAERQAINAPLQGSNADIIKIAMVQIDRWLHQNKLKTKMILQIHDELLFDAPEHEIPELKKNISSIMQNVVNLSVPLEVNCGVGMNWTEAH